MAKMQRKNPDKYEITEGCRYMQKHSLAPDIDDPLTLGDILQRRFRIDSKLGEGSHGQVYEAMDLKEHKPVAIKTYKRDRDREMPREALFLQELQSLKAVPRFILHSKHGDIQFTAMELVGPSLSLLCDLFFPLSIQTVFSLGVKMLERIFEVHNAGLIHGDIKPSNFAIGQPPNRTRKVYLLDLSLTRRQDDPRNSKAGKKRVFGTLRFAGRPRHLAHSHTIVDDFYSFLYTLLDLRMKLPWRKERDKDQVYAMKEELTDDLLVTNLHHNFYKFKEYIDNLNGVEPNQKILKDFITTAMKATRNESSALYEWEREPQKVWDKSKNASSTSRSLNT